MLLSNPVAFVQLGFCARKIRQLSSLVSHVQLLRSATPYSSTIVPWWRMFSAGPQDFRRLTLFSIFRRLPLGSTRMIISIISYTLYAIGPRASVLRL